MDMTVGKTALLTASLGAVFAVGIMTGPAIRDQWSKMNTPNTTNAPEATAAAPVVEPSVPAPAKAEQPAARARSSSPRAHEAVAKKDDVGTVRMVAVTMWEPELRDRVKAVFNPGTRLEIAAEGFGDPEEFVTVAHAARNTKVPFVVLKDRVLNQGQSLAEAIHEFKPDLDAKAEVNRARAAAQSDLS
jgi:hypothetical protein